MAKERYTIYELEDDFKRWVTTDLNEMVRFCLFMGELGHSNTAGSCQFEIPLMCLFKY